VTTSRRQQAPNEARRLEAVGRLAGGVAHDLNNLLTVIAGYAELLRGGVEDSDDRRALDEIRAAAKKAASLSRELLAFGQNEAGELQAMDLNRVISGIREMLSRLATEEVSFRCELHPTLGPVMADRALLEQAVVHLVGSARDAVGSVGAITLRTFPLETDATIRPAGLPPGSYVCLSVSDDRGGDPESTEQVFEPHFSDPDGGLDQDLGLASAYGIVKQLGGELTVGSGPEGTTFTAYLNQAESSVRSESWPTPAPADDGPATVLVVEDEESVRKLVRIMLTRSGHRVIESARPEEALDLARTHADEIDLLLTDVVMPQMNGRELAERIQQIRPMPVVFMSGYTGDALATRRVLDADTVLLQKPFTAAQLASALREALDG
jgi:CheY-like chemotaxis protein